MAVGAAMPFFKGRRQEDSHEFTTFLLDVVKEECPRPDSTFASLFFGQFESTTICAHCGVPETRREIFSSISATVSELRKFILSPYDLTRPMERIFRPPDGISAIFIGVTAKGARQISAEFLPEFVEATALEFPPPEPGFSYALLRLVDAKKKSLQAPILLPVPIGAPISPEALTCRVVDRIRPFAKSPTIKVTLVSPPETFTVKDGRALAVEPVTAQVTQQLLSLRTAPIVPPMRASEIAAAFFNETRLDSDNMWKCDACGEESCALRRVALLSAPPNLILHLKRFKMRGKHIERDNAEVLLDNELDLSRFVVDGGDALQYQLVGVVCHSGTVGFGHYTAYGKRAGDWFSFNDATVVQRAPPRVASAAPYVLYYARVPPSAPPGAVEGAGEPADDARAAEEAEEPAEEAADDGPAAEETEEPAEEAAEEPAEEASAPAEEED
jgi:hypothetical protein